MVHCYLCLIGITKQEIPSRYPARSLTLGSSTSAVTELPKLDLESHPTQDNIVTTSKRAHHRSESIQLTSTRTPSPPHKKFAADNIFCSPEREDLKEALRVGGTINMDVRQCKTSFFFKLIELTHVTVLDLQNENIQFYPIPTRPLLEMLKDPRLLSYDVETVECSMGQLTIDTSSTNMLGAGAFKTAHPGWLTLIPPAVSGLGVQKCHNVAVKRPYYKVYPPGTSKTPSHFKIGRYTLADEVPKLLKEANVLYWAQSLLQLTYDFIDRCVANSSQPPPFKVPRVRFVDAGLAFAYGPAMHTSKAGSKSSSARTGYLVEELIPGGADEFVKYIHNMDSNPLLNETDYGYDLALFFAFTQHVQYVKTGGLAFISDYQGMFDVNSV
jgi:hypothetical protein